ncbi:MAG: TIGR03618 family F420-dependent PPOX class oxidoreductase [Dehalococcoidia bacterium]|nr:TIGR03618 family F420-dependent PPOX class oxidoreductase [Dehalococcoidia bacterium]
MPKKLPAAVCELLDRPVLAHVATLMRDGSPQVTPVWVDTDGEYVYINTAQGRTKARNLKKDALVALSIADVKNGTRNDLQIRGRVVEVTTQGADEHIDKLSMKYSGRAYAGWLAGAGRGKTSEVRIKIKILPEHLVGAAANIS